MYADTSHSATHIPRPKMVLSVVERRHPLSLPGTPAMPAAIGPRLPPHCHHHHAPLVVVSLKRALLRLSKSVLQPILRLLASRHLRANPLHHPVVVAVTRYPSNSKCFRILTLTRLTRTRTRTWITWSMYRALITNITTVLSVPRSKGLQGVTGPA